MTNREIYFSLKKQNNKYLTDTAIKTILIEVSHYKNFVDLIHHFDETNFQIEAINQIVERVKNGEPLQYVIGKAYFIDFEYYVSPDVLIPRQETEQFAVGCYFYINKLFQQSRITILDLCTGSGIIALYLKSKFPNANVFATDISKKALQIANKNAKKHKLLVTFLEGDKLEPVINKHLKFDVLVCNPPYIKDQSTVDEQTLKYEPHIALFATPQTLFYEAIIRNVGILMNEKFFIGFEIEDNMQEELTLLIQKNIPGCKFNFEKDICNKTRYLYIYKF